MVDSPTEPGLWHCGASWEDYAFSGIRELEVYTRLDWISAQPWRRLNFMQRNKVAFDSPTALKAALNSPVRHEMRADFKTFSAFSGPNTHFAMATHRVQP